MPWDNQSGKRSNPRPAHTRPASPAQAVNIQSRASPLCEKPERKKENNGET